MNIDDVIYDVIIIGAGPVGLATAVGLKKRGIENFLVLDQARAFRKVGQVVDILPNGLKALKYLDKQAYDAALESSLSLSQPIHPSRHSPKWYVRDLEGQEIRAIPLDFNEWLQKYGEGRISITWFNLQTALRGLLPPEKVKANHRCINIVPELENDCIRVDFRSNFAVEVNPYAHWESQNIDKNINNINDNLNDFELTSLRSKLVIGADGINSTIRKFIYQDTSHADFASPIYSGYAAISCQEIANIPKNIATKIKDKFLHSARIVTLTNAVNPQGENDAEIARMILLNRDTGIFKYIFHVPVSWEQLQEVPLLDLSLQQLDKHNFPDEIKELVRLSNPNEMEHRPYYINCATVSNSFPFPATTKVGHENNSQSIQLPWHQDRIALVGDAAHGMPPFAAQGVNQGFEDALTMTELVSQLVVSQQLNNIEAIQKKFAKYESLRRSLMEYVQQITMTGVNYAKNQEELENYNQRVFGRDFEQVMAALNQD